MKKKKLDCVEMKRTCQEKIREMVRGMSRQEELAFFRQAGRDLEKRIRSARGQAERSPRKEP